MKRRGRRILLAYLLLLILSHGVRWFQQERSQDPSSEDHRAAQGRPFVFIEEVGGADSPPRDIRLSYQQWGDDDGAPVVLLHGSPGSSNDFARLGPKLAAERTGAYWAVAPDLPGFGDSEHDVADYSILAHARYTLQLMDQLSIQRAHLVGFSMGGGVVLEMQRLAPERVRSLSLVSAIGVQELELLGNYHLNHGLHGLQLGGLWLMREGLPHFGVLDDTFLGVPYARNFFDTDQRPLRGILRAYDGPMLIVHGRGDVLVPMAAAREHHRLVPQSRLVELERNHFFVFSAPEIFTEPLLAFLDQVDRGAAATREEVTPELRRQALEPFDPSVVPSAQGFSLVVLFLLLATATLISEDLTCIATGLMISAGRLGFFPGTLACITGIFVGDLMLYLAGRWLGRPALGRRPLRWLIDEDDVERGSRWFRRRGPLVILLSRFLPGTRLGTYFVAGLLHTRFWRFAGYFLLAVVLWTPALVGLAAWLGDDVHQLLERFGRGAWALAAAALVLLVAVRLAVSAATHQGRRRMLGRWRRWTRWEYWPRWVFYPPVVLYVLYLGLRHRHLTLFTAANPAIPDSGFVGESKSAILQGLSESPELVARWRLLPAATEPEQRKSQARSFLQEYGLSLPVVLKPDVGERGSGVRVIRTEDALDRALGETTEDLLIQEYVGGEEFGVFYLRLPEEPNAKEPSSQMTRGRIFSITDKRLPAVTGDGRRTLENLILDDDRLVPMARHYFKAQRADLDEVLEAGEERRLVDLGTHCRGALFFDAGDLASEELLEVLDRACRHYQGFYFGRFDLRVPTREHLRRGEGIRVLELNGVTSEATHIYDPAGRLTDAYRTLFEQWCLAFEIGRRNVERGHRATGVVQLLRSLVRSAEQHS
ncbi:MAG: alpha/beta fold hydrolase [Acidobacteriota bacterium]|nr:alpha/beta fold hydrolase [Acidobacteriota bacterium]